MCICEGGYSPTAAISSTVRICEERSDAAIRYIKYAILKSGLPRKSDDFLAIAYLCFQRVSLNIVPIKTGRKTSL